MTPTKKTPTTASARPVKTTAAKKSTATSKTTTPTAKASTSKKPSLMTKEVAPVAKRATTGVKAPVKEAVAAKKAPAVKKTAETASKAVVSKAQARPVAKVAVGPYAGDAKFLEEQTKLLDADRAIYQGQAIDLKAEADSLAQEREPGDVQFDEESGEGGTVTVDRERDLALSAQALLAVEEIDDALVRITKRTYGACERCRQPIPKPRLKALPYARLCVACKSGGLSRR
jgi:DnaK suppressor protein